MRTVYSIAAALHLKRASQRDAVNLKYLQAVEDSGFTVRGIRRSFNAGRKHCGLMVRQDIDNG